ncbi:Alpha/beta hydrolase family-domain-containing protein [Mycena vitilis]|nr:Alpha/beta hydrolase family-domain-containing protein [Mycena vitilis]
MLIFAFSLLFHLSSILVASSASCGCSSVVIPVHVDVSVAKNSTDPFAGLKSNASDLRRVEANYDIHGVFCQPEPATANESDVVQILVHGFTYTGEYWAPPIAEFRNYSYAAFSCARGLSTLAIDSLGTGLSSRPANASDVQYQTSSGALSQVARHLKSASILPGVAPFKKIIGIGHSGGAAHLNFGALVEGAQSPFDGLILTSFLMVTADTVLPLPPLVPAREDDPSRWAALDPAYVTTSNRTFFYPVNTAAFSPRMYAFDAFTRDPSSISTLLQGAISTLTTLYTGPVAKVMGSEDQLFCKGTGRCDDVAALTAQEQVVWPKAQTFEVIVEQGSGHDMNLDFLANNPFATFVALVERFSRV